jgi:hypothetical protein
MKRRGWPLAIYVALLALYVLHNDFWLWNDPRLLLGLPIGLVYHIGFCVVASAVLTLLVVLAWPPVAVADAAAAADPAAARQGEPR